MARVTSIAVDGDVRAGDVDARALGERGDRRFVVERHAVAQRLPADRAVHRAAVDVAVAERARNRARDGALAGAGRSVDGDDREVS